jgi:hypothetical protein
MKLNLTAAAAIVLGGASLLGGPGAHATPMISVGACTGASCSPTTIAGPSFPAVGFAATEGSFTVSGSATGVAVPGLTSLDSQAIDISTTTAGTVDVFVTMQGNTFPTGNQLTMSSFTSNILEGGTSPTATLSTFLDTANGLYTTAPTATLIAHDTFTGPGASGPIFTLENFSSSVYSLTEEYAVTFTGSCSPECNANLTIDFQVPAPPIGHGLLVLLAVGGMLFSGKFLGHLKTRQLHAAA